MPNAYDYGYDEHKWRGDFDGWAVHSVGGNDYLAMRARESEYWEYEEYSDDDIAWLDFMETDKAIADISTSSDEITEEWSI